MDFLDLLPKETGLLGVTAAALTGLFTWLTRRADREVTEAKTDAATLAALVARIDRMEGREKAHEAEIADLRTRATQLAGELAVARADVVKAQSDVVKMAGEVAKSDAVTRGLLKENRQLRRSLGQNVPSEPPPGGES